MTLRDLTKRQLYNLRRRCEKLRRIHWTVDCVKRIRVDNMFQCHMVGWNAGFNAGLKAGLEQQSK